MDLPNRKPTRLKSYDYSTPGAYFITVCTREKRCILSRIVKRQSESVGALHEAPAVELVLTPEGKCVRRYIEAVPSRWPMVHMDRYVIMPNHIHLLLSVESGRAIRESPLQAGGKRSLISNVIGYLKMNSSRDIHAIRPEEIVWQRSFYDHVIRGEDDYRTVAEYIDGNPMKWSEDRFYIPD